MNLLAVYQLKLAQWENCKLFMLLIINLLVLSLLSGRNLVRCVSGLVVHMCLDINFVSLKFISLFLKSDNLRLENNKINGTIPFDNCKEFDALSSDCSAPINVECPCCTRCFGVFTTHDDALECPSSVLNLKYDSFAK